MVESVLEDELEIGSIYLTLRVFFLMYQIPMMIIMFLVKLLVLPMLLIIWVFALVLILLELPVLCIKVMSDNLDKDSDADPQDSQVHQLHKTPNAVEPKGSRMLEMHHHLEA